MNSKKEVLEGLLKRPYTMILRRDEDGDVIAQVKEFEGCVADGADEAEALRNLREVMALWIGSRLDSALPIPAPDDEQDLPSGKWLQRVPRALHRDLIALADSDGTSLNQLVTSILSVEIGRREGRGRANIHSVQATCHVATDRWLGSAPQLDWQLLGTVGRARERVEGVFVQQLLEAIPSNPTKLPEMQEVKGAADAKDRQVWTH